MSPEELQWCWWQEPLLASEGQRGLGRVSLRSSGCQISWMELAGGRPGLWDSS